MISVARVLVTVLLSSGALLSQPRVDFGGRGSKPKNPMTFPGTSLTRYALVTSPGTLLAKPREGSGVIRRTDFGQKFVVYAEDTKRQYYLVRTESEPAVWGWVQRSAVLAKLECMRSPENGSFLKVVTTNDRSASESLAGIAAVYAGPGEGYDVLEQNGPGELFYVFDRAKLKNGADYVLLGTDAQWDPAKGGSDRIIRGWVRLDQCVLWGSRIAVYYNRKNIGRRRSVAVYASLADLRAGDERKAVMLEPGGIWSLSHDRPRFPILWSDGQIARIAFIDAKSGTAQPLHEGWVQMYDGGERLLEPWVYMERTELEEFRGFLTSLLKASDFTLRASLLVKEAVTRATGDPLLRGETVTEYVKRELALPFREDSTLLSKTPEELQRSLADVSYRTQFRKRVGYSYEALALIFEERDPNALFWDEAQNKWVRTTPRPPEVKFWVTTKSGQRFCWIPLDLLP